MAVLPAHAALRVTATTTLVADLARAVGGDHVEVTALMGPGVDPHLYKPSAGDVTALRRADVILYSGLQLEGRMIEVFESLRRRGRKVSAVAEAVPVERRLAGDYGAHDPHVWGDPELWAFAAEATARAFTEADPANAARYAAKAAALAEEFRALRDWGRAQVAQIPEGRRVLVTSHDAFRYFGRAFGLEVVGVQGLSTATEAGLADVTRIADLVKQRGLRAIFVESSVPPAAIQRISKDSGARIGGELFSDALGSPGEMVEVAGERHDVGTYAGMLRHNLLTVVTALR
ncbi:MAG TPA: zinc ABC transporter substrate-binding protein [Verrucomicrobiota bacterium]|nr:zinc ABC transporter substrate-binding protein [Verrucomicrobiota bacterium]